MKHLLVILLLVISVHTYSQTKITFDETSQGVLVNGELRTDATIDLRVEKGTFVSFEVPTGRSLVLTIKGAGSKTLAKGLNKTDNSLAFDEFSIADKKFTLEFKKGQTTIFSKEFSCSIKPADDHTSGSPKAYTPGFLYYDALILSDASSPHFGVVFAYYDQSKKPEVFRTSKFFEKVRENKKVREKEKLDEGATTHSLLSSSLSGAAGAIAGLDVTSYADGLAKFLVQRTKEELSQAFFDKLKAELSDDKYKDFRVLFPKTLSLLNVAGEQVYDYKQYISNLREAFRSDIENLHRNFPGIIPNHPEIKAELKVAIQTGSYVAIELESETHPGDILANYPVQFLDELGNKNYNGSFQTVQLLSEALRDFTTSEDGSRYWVTARQIRDLVGHKEAFKIFLGLLQIQAEQKYGKVQFSNTDLFTVLTSLSQTIDEQFEHYQAYKTFVLGFSSKADALSKMIKSQEKITSDSLRFELYAKYFKTSVDLIEYSMEVVKLPYLKDALPQEIPQKMEAYFDISYTTADMVVAINRKNYPEAINQAIHIYDVVKNMPEKKVISTLSDETKKAVDKHLKSINELTKMQAKVVTEEGVELHRPSDDFFEKFIKYGTFFSSVAKAKDSDEVQKVIQTYALPTGSARIKRASYFNVSLNAYVGLYGGWERIKGIDNKFSFNAYGLTAPVGLSISRGHSLFLINTGESEWSTTLFLSLIDVGALVSFRFKNNEVDLDPTGDTTAVVSQTPTLHFEDIFSPGAFVSIGIPKTPISVNGGFQVGPNLRKVSVVDNDGNPVPQFDYSNNMYVRWSISICVDIPILTLHNQRDKK